MLLDYLYWCVYTGLQLLVLSPTIGTVAVKISTMFFSVFSAGGTVAVYWCSTIDTVSVYWSPNIGTITGYWVLYYWYWVLLLCTGPRLLISTVTEYWSSTIGIGVCTGPPIIDTGVCTVPMQFTVISRSLTMALDRSMVYTAWRPSSDEILPPPREYTMATLRPSSRYRL